VERRTFVSVAPTTTKSKLGPNFFQNIFLVYILLVKKQKKGQKTDQNPEKKQSFRAPFRALVSPSSLSLPFTNTMYMKCLFLQKKSVYLAFSSCRSANCNCPPRIGGHHFLLCQHTNTKDIAGQSATAPLAPQCVSRTGEDLFCTSLFARSKS